MSEEGNPKLSISNSVVGRAEAASVSQRHFASYGTGFRGPLDLVTATGLLLRVKATPPAATSVGIYTAEFQSVGAVVHQNMTEQWLRAIVQNETHYHEKSSDAEFSKKARITINKLQPGYRMHTKIILPDTDYRKAVHKSWSQNAPLLYWKSKRVKHYSWLPARPTSHADEQYKLDCHLQAVQAMAELNFNDRTPEMHVALLWASTSSADTDDADDANTNILLEAMSSQFRPPHRACDADPLELLKSLKKHAPKLCVLEDAVELHAIRHGERLVVVVETGVEVKQVTLFIKYRFPSLKHAVVVGQTSDWDDKTKVGGYYHPLADAEADDISILITTRCTMLDNLHSLYSKYQTLVVLSCPQDCRTLIQMIRALYNGATPHIVDVYLALTKHTWEEKAFAAQVQKYVETSKDDMVVRHCGTTFYNVTLTKIATLTGFRLPDGQYRDVDFVNKPQYADIGIGRDGNMLSKEQREQNLARFKLLGAQHHAFPYDFEIRDDEVEVAERLQQVKDEKDPWAAKMRKLAEERTAREAEAEVRAIEEANIGDEADLETDEESSE